MAQSKLCLLAIAAGVILTACGEQAPSSGPPVAAAPSGAVREDDRIGVAECDDYVDHYEACLAANVPEDVRAALRAALQQTRTTWRKASSNKGGQEAMAAVCQRARAAARPSLVARGCTDF